MLGVVRLLLSSFGFSYCSLLVELLVLFHNHHCMAKTKNRKKKPNKNNRSWSQLFWHLKLFHLRFGEKKKRLKWKRSYLVNVSVKKLLVLKTQVFLQSWNEGNSQHCFSVFWKVCFSALGLSTGPRSWVTSKIFFSQKSLDPKESPEYFCFFNWTSLRPPRRFFSYTRHTVRGKLKREFTTVKIW